MPETERERERALTSLTLYVTHIAIASQA